MKALNTTAVARGSLTANDLLFSGPIPGVIYGRLDRNIAVHIGAKALGRLGREMIGLADNATCVPVRQRGEFLFSCMDGPVMNEVPATQVEKGIVRRLTEGAASFGAAVSRIEWKEQRIPGATRVQMTVQLSPRGLEICEM